MLHNKGFYLALLISFPGIFAGKAGDIATDGKRYKYMHGKHGRDLIYSVSTKMYSLIAQHGTLLP